MFWYPDVIDLSRDIDRVSVIGFRGFLLSFQQKVLPLHCQTNY